MMGFQKTVSARVYRMFLAQAERNGCDPRAIAKAMGLGEDSLENPYARISRDQHLSLLKIAADWTVPFEPVKNGIAGWLRPFPELAGVVCNCPTLNDAMQQFVQYRDIIGNVDWVTIQQSDNSIAIEYMLEGDGQSGGRAIGNFAIIADLARLYDPGVEVGNAELSGAPSPAYKTWSDVIGTRIEHDQPRNRLVLRSKELHAPFVKYNEALASIHLDAAVRMRESIRGRASFTGQVNRHLHEWLRDASDDLSQERLQQRLCEQLGISRWTLQRRLQAEQVQFGHLLNLARVHEATRLLTHTQLPISEIADRMRFGSTSAFTRFFTRAYGTPPTRYRAANWRGTDPWTTNGQA
jgi:AraC-like DNA-binding protein